MVDVDGVIVAHPHPEGWSRELENDLGISPDRLNRAFFARHWDDIVHGRAALHDRLGPVLAEIAPHVTSQTLADYWFRRDAHLDSNLLGELDELREQGLEVHLATVQEHERAGFLWTHLGLSEHCDATHYSAALGCTKPAARLFELIEDRTGLSGAEVFFIDDKLSNVIDARARGWNAAVWTGRRQLRELLAETGAWCGR